VRARFQRAAALVLSVAVAVLAAGCGGSTAPSRADYGKDVDRICATLNDRVEAIQQQSPTTVDGIVAYADKLSKTVDDGVRQLKAVQRPDGEDGAKAKRWLDELQRQADATRPALAALKDAARRRDTAAIQAAVKRIQALDSQKVNQLARDAGARVCGG
jgi:hypothetical protein